MRNFVCRKGVIQSGLIVGLGLLSVAGARAQDVGGKARESSLMMLDPTEKVWSLQVTSKSHLTVQKGDVVVNSTHKGALWIADGTIEALDGQIRDVGGVTNMGKTVPKPAPVIGAAPEEDPIPEFLIPPPGREISREMLSVNYEAEATLTPGIYSGGIHIVGNDSVITLQPGVYVMNGGDFFVSGALVQGKGVTIVMSGAKPGMFWIAGNARLDLSAPTEGSLKNLLVVSRSEGWNKLQFSSAKGRFKGLIYAPKAGVGVSGSDLTFDRLICANLGLTLEANVQITGEPVPVTPADAADAADGKEAPGDALKANVQ